MITFLIVLLLIIVIIVVIYLIGMKPYVHRGIHFNKLHPYIESLFKCGYNGGFIIIHLENNKDIWLQFSKYITQDGKKGLQCDFPLAPWSKRYYDNFMNKLNEFGIKYEIEPVNNNIGNNKVESFVTVDFGKDLERLTNFANKVFVEVFGASVADKVYLYFGNTAPSNVEI